MDYCIENEILRVTVRTKGAELVSVIKKATGEEMLWQPNPDVWPRQAPILFPYCGRLRDGKYMWKDAEYAGGQHGFARDLEHTLEEQTAERLVFCLEANALTMEKYPFPFKLRSTFTLDGATLLQAIEVVNDGDEVMSFGFGFHPGFACPFDAQHTVEDYAFTFDVPETPQVVEISESTGLCMGGTHPYFENGTEIPLSDHLFDHDSICLSDLCGKTLSLVEKPTGRRIAVDIADFPYVLIWSAKGPLQFACIEPWHTLPDAADASGRWEDKQPALTVQPGESWHTQLTVHFER